MPIEPGTAPRAISLVYTNRETNGEECDKHLLAQRAKGARSTLPEQQKFRKTTNVCSSAAGEEDVDGRPVEDTGHPHNSGTRANFGVPDSGSPDQHPQNSPTPQFPFDYLRLPNIHPQIIHVPQHSKSLPVLLFEKHVTTDNNIHCSQRGNQHLPRSNRF